MGGCCAVKAKAKMAMGAIIGRSFGCTNCSGRAAVGKADSSASLRNDKQRAANDGRLPLCCQVFPCWVFLFDQSYLLRSVPVFQFFFAGDGVADVGEALVVDETIDVIAGGVRAGYFSAVLCEADAKCCLSCRCTNRENGSQGCIHRRCIRGRAWTKHSKAREGNCRFLRFATE
jgi:hypothetical protein